MVFSLHTKKIEALTNAGAELELKILE